MVRTATPFPMVSLLFVFTAFVISNIGHIRPQRTILAFVSGIFFILSGGNPLLMSRCHWLWLITVAWCVVCHTRRHSITDLFLVYDAGVLAVICKGEVISFLLFWLCVSLELSRLSLHFKTHKIKMMNVGLCLGIVNIVEIHAMFPHCHEQVFQLDFLQ